MRTVLNIIWLLTGGIWLALGYLLAGVLACIFIVTIPVGTASFRMASYTLWPFGRSIVPRPQSNGAVSGVANVLWFVVAGWWLALGHLTTALAQAATVVGLPLAAANIKLIGVSLAPFGKEIVDNDQLAARRDAIVGF